MQAAMQRHRGLAIMALMRLGMGLFTLFAVSLAIFLSIEILPGDTAEAMLGQQATPEAIAAIRRELRLDLPPHVRYMQWLVNVLQGDLGNSLVNHQPVADKIVRRLSNTLLLASITAILAVPMAVGLGLLAALYRNTWLDRLLSFGALSVGSFPAFLVAYILIAVFAVQLRIFPAISQVYADMSLRQILSAIILPCLTLTCVMTAHILRLTRAALLNVLSAPYLEMAALKGLTRAWMLVGHALPNALAPIITVIMLTLARLLTGVVVIEVIFAYPGLGQLLVDSVSVRDLPVVQACGMIFAGVYVVLNLSADILTLLSNPRLRHPK